MNTDKKKMIVDLLEEFPHGLIISDMTRIFKKRNKRGLKNRLTITKYVHELLGEGKIKERNVGVVKIYYLKKYWMVKRWRRK